MSSRLPDSYKYNSFGKFMASVLHSKCVPLLHVKNGVIAVSKGVVLL